MLIALDYDKTYTADPFLWDIFIDMAHSRKHKVIILTMRKPNEEITINKIHRNVVDIYYTSRKAKKLWAEAHNLNVDIWIDDKPAYLFDDHPST